MTDISERLQDDRRIARIAGVTFDGTHQEIAVDGDGLLRVDIAALTYPDNQAIWVQTRHFFPVGGTVGVAFSGTSARVELPPPGAYAETLKIHNPTDHLVFIRVGDAGVVAQVPDYPVPPHSEATLRHSIDIDVPQSHLAVIAETGSGMIYCTLGSGS